MKMKTYVVLPAIVLLAFLSSIFTSCNDNSVGPISYDYSQLYSDSLIFLSNRFSDDPSEYHICICCVDGTGLRQLFGKWDVQQIAWDLVRGKIYFAADTYANDGTYQIYQSELDGSNELHLITTNFPISDIEVSPDGERLAYLEFMADQNRLSLLNITAKEITVCTEFLSDLLQISWGPDDNKLACTYRSGGDVRLKSFNLETNRFTSERLFVDMVKRFNHVDWCKSNNKLAVNVNHYGFAVSYLFDYTTKTDTNLTAGNYYVEGLSWAPDGEKIAYAQTYNHLTVSSIYIYNKNGTNAFQVTDNLFDDKFPCWQ